MPKRDAQFVLGIVVVCAAAYWNALGNGFVPDDYTVILHNSWVREAGSLRCLLTRDYFQASRENTYRPVATLLYYLEYRAWGPKPMGYHLVSLAAHACAAALLYVLLSRLFGCRGLALLASMLFAVHPVNTEAVNAIGFREDVLCLPAMLGAWLFYLRADDPGRRRPGNVALAWLLFVVSLLAKEVTVSLPVLIVGHDCLLRHRPAQAFRRHWGAYLGFGLIALLFIAFRLWGMRTPFEASIPYTTGSFGAQLLITPGIVAHYLRLMLWPVRLCADYWFGIVAGPGDPRFWGPVLALVAAAAAAVWACRRAPAMLLGVLWFVLTLAPAANIFPMVNPMAERYLYVPCAGFCLALAVPFARLMRGRGGAALAWVTVLVFAGLTMARNPVWGDARRLNAGAARLWPGCARAQSNLGLAYERQGLLPLAAAQHRRVVRTTPQAVEGHLYLGRILVRRGRVDEGVRLLKRARLRDPERVQTWDAFANAYAAKGDPVRALAALAQARRFEGNHRAALACLHRALAMRPDSTMVLVLLASTFEDMERTDDAAAAWQRVTQLNPKMDLARERLQELRGRRGSGPEELR